MVKADRLQIGIPALLGFAPKGNEVLRNMRRVGIGREGYGMVPQPTEAPARSVGFEDEVALRDGLDGDLSRRPPEGAVGVPTIDPGPLGRDGPFDPEPTELGVTSGKVCACKRDKGGER
jgi:hypothetical protein